MPVNNAVKTPTSKSPGAMLQHARERAGVSLEHVSEQTMIPLSRLSALEEDNFERVGGAAYVVGYARNAAVVIGVDPKPIVDAYTVLLNSGRKPTVLVEDFDQSVTGLILPKKTRPILIGVSGVSILAFIILIIFFTDSSDRPNGEMSQQQSLAPKDLRGREPSVEQARPVDSDALTAKLSAEKQLNVDPLIEGIAPIALVSEDKVSSVIDDSQAESRENVVDVLSIFFTDECWVQVIDASGRKLLARVGSSGDHLRVEGLPPFDVKLGNAEAVLIELNGAPVEVVPRRGKRTLRFSVGS